MKTWKLAGQAGYGIAVTGTMFAKLCMRHGLHVFTYGEYPSLIRGGHNTIQVTVDTSQTSAQRKLVDILIALNAEGVSLHLDELTDKSIVIVDKSQIKLESFEKKILGKIIDLPSHKIAMDATGSGIAANMVTLGASTYLMSLELELLNSLIEEAFSKKGKEVVEKNILAAKRGYEFLKETGILVQELGKIDNSPQVYVTGNEAIGLGAIAGGIQFYDAYPMTPASSLLDFLASQQDNYPIVVKHAEDEIGAINQAIGASYAGARAMVGTSGGGFSLMVEAISLAGITEVPLVVMDGQRPGPATGMPTWTAQADLQFVLNAGHGEFGRVVLAPGDAVEAFVYTRLAFMIAEQWQTQVYLLTDKYLIESAQSVPRFQENFVNHRYSMVDEALPTDNSYLRYEITPNGYSKRSVPGQPHGLHLTNSYEHDEYGYATEDSKMASQMVEKRLRKLESVLSVLPKPLLIGPKIAKVTFVSWGSTKLPVEQAVKEINRDEPNTANAIHLATLSPFPREDFLMLANEASRLVMIEGNATRQAERLIFAETEVKITERINQFDGRPFYPEDIIQFVQKGSKE